MGETLGERDRRAVRTACSSVLSALPAFRPKGKFHFKLRRSVHINLQEGVATDIRACRPHRRPRCAVAPAGLIFQPKTCMRRPLAIRHSSHAGAHPYIFSRCRGHRARRRAPSRLGPGRVPLRAVAGCANKRQWHDGRRPGRAAAPAGEPSSLLSGHRSLLPSWLPGERPAVALHDF